MWQKSPPRHCTRRAERRGGSPHPLLTVAEAARRTVEETAVCLTEELRMVVERKDSLTVFSKGYGTRLGDCLPLALSCKKDYYTPFDTVLP
mmetsp:Transcript_13003/g.36882  ORF Transcript_13003/g.36882 Transcript_13003/m.36882 type:complete len:91 (-) Transcript_13003:25-297(-)